MVCLTFGELGYYPMKQKILFVIESLGGGGAEKVLATIVKHIDQERFDVAVCPIVGTGVYVDEIRKYAKYLPILSDVQSLSPLQKIWYRIKYKLIYKILPMSWVYRLWIPKGYDTEIAFCEGFATKLMAASLNRGARKVAWVHCDLKHFPWPQQRGIFRTLKEERDAYGKYDKIITVSRIAESSFKEVYGLGDRLQTIYNPIDTEEIKNKAKEIITGNRYNSSVPNIISVGRLVPAKGYDILLRAVKRLKDEGNNLHLTILGEGEQRVELETFIRENKLEDTISLPGFVKNPYPYIAQSDLFICSSRSEGYSLVIAEALVLGVPVVSTDCSGPRELLNEGEFGLLVKNEESGVGLYEGVKKMVGNNEMRNNFGKIVHCRGQEIGITHPIKDINNIFGCQDRVKS